MAAPLLYTDPESGELRRRSWSLQVIEGADAGRRAEVDRSPALIGAAPAAVLVLTDDTVSRYHLEMDVFAEGIRLRDLDSTNGTFVSDVRIRDAFVESGDTFRLGRTTVHVIGSDEPAAPEIDTDPRGVPLGAVEWLGGALAVSDRVRGLFETLRQVSPSPSAVLFEGEPGSGKATCARVVHDLSPRSTGPFVSIEIPDGSAPDEVDRLLFGWRDKPGGDAGAGTPGVFERASGGTLFIEKADHLPRATQARVLRAIESGEVQRKGEKRRRRVDVRLMSSCTSAPGATPGLEPNLLRRLAVVRLEVPPLRERPEDIAALARHFMESSPNASLGIGPRLDAGLREGSWPRNGDQLREVVLSFGKAGAEDTAYRPLFVADCVAAERGDVSAAAAKLDLTSFALFRYLARHEVDLDEM